MAVKPEPNPIHGVLMTLANEVLWCIAVIGGFPWLR
jgi:hypothetical protein